MTPFILGLDISSSAIGYVVWGGAVRDRGVIRLDKAAWIGKRCVAARDALSSILDQYAVDLIALESPVARFAKAVIPQARVSGIILELAERRGILTCEVTPKAAKLALAEDGSATKREMLMAAAPHFGYLYEPLSYRCFREEWIACLGVRVYGEHEADALGVAMAAVGMVEVEQSV